jgi:hypothetical protein
VELVVKIFVLALAKPTLDLGLWNNRRSGQNPFLMFTDVVTDVGPTLPTGGEGEVLLSTPFKNKYNKNMYWGVEEKGVLCSKGLP